MKVRAYKVREWAKLPVRAYETDAGMDLFFCPEDNALKSIKPRGSVLLSTGLKIEVPEGYMLALPRREASWWVPVLLTADTTEKSLSTSTTLDP